MSSNLYEVSGISLDNTISILYGTDIPGTSLDTIAAPQGSVYFDTSGVTWKKINAGEGTASWSKDSGGGGSVVSGINSLRNVTGNTVVDSLDAAVIDTGVWAITTSSVANPLNRQTVIVTGSHNGSIAKYSLYSRMDFGTKIQGISYDVRLTNGSFELVVFAPVFANIDCYRLNAISNGSTVTLVTAGGSGGSGVDLTPQLTAEIAARTAADAALDTKISGKADITGLATQFTSINNQLVLANAALDTETNARIAADIALQAAIDASVAGATTTTAGIVQVGSGLAIDANGVLSVDNAGVGAGVETAMFTFDGLVTPSVGKVRWYPPVATILKELYFAVGTVGTTPTSVQPRLNGVLIGSPILCAAGDYKSAVVAFGTAVTPADYITLDIIEGTTSADIYATLVYAIDATAIPVATEFSGVPVVETVQVFNFEGMVTPSTGVSRWYPYEDSVAVKFYASIDYVSSEDIVLSLRKNGASTGFQITILAGEYKSNTTLVGLDITISDYLTLDILSGNGGSNLYASVVINKPVTSTTTIALPKASTNNLGYIRVGSGLAIDGNGVLSVIAVTSVAPPKEFSIFVKGSPVSGELVGMYIPSKNCTFSAVSYANALVSPAVGGVFTITKNSTQIGTISFDLYDPPSIAFTDSSVGAGDILAVRAPLAEDATLADIAITLVMTPL